MAKNKFKIEKKNKSLKKSKNSKKSKNKDQKEAARKAMNAKMDQLAHQISKDKKAKNFEKIGLPKIVKTDDIEKLIEKM